MPIKLTLNLKKDNELSVKEFYDYIENNIKVMNAKVGFWRGFYYRMYEDDQITLDEALKKLNDMSS